MEGYPASRQSECKLRLSPFFFIPFFFGGGGGGGGGALSSFVSLLFRIVCLFVCLFVLYNCLVSSVQEVCDISFDKP